MTRPHMLALLLAAASQVPAQDKTSVLRDLDSQTYQTQRRAVTAARTVRSEPIMEKIIELAEKAAHPNIRDYALETLGHYRDPRIFPILERTLSGTVKSVKVNASARLSALIAIGLQQNKRSFDILVKSLDPPLEHLPRWRSWFATSQGMRHLKDPRAAKHLARILRENLDQSDAYGSITEVIAELDPNLAVDQFFAILTNPRVYSHHNLTSLLGGIKSQEVRERATSLVLDKEQSESVRSHAAQILGQVADTRSISVLLTVMEQAEAQTSLKIAAVNALGETRHELAVPQLARYLRVDESDQRKAVAKALGRIGHATATRPLVQALRKEEELETRIRIIEALGRVGDRRAINVIGAYLDDEAVLHQPATVSRDWPFPHNTPVHFLTWWAIRRIRIGKEPCSLGKLARPLTATDKNAMLEKVRQTKIWWDEHRSKSEFRLRK